MTTPSAPPEVPLSAPLDISVDYTRSLGPVLSQFMTALASRRILGSRGSDGRVRVPPAEYDPVSFRPPEELVPAGPDGTVVTWSWQPEISMIVTPVRLHYLHGASAEESRYLRALSRGKIIGQRCPACGKVCVPPRGACPVDGVPTTTDVELPGHGTVTTFCVVSVPFQGQRIPRRI